MSWCAAGPKYKKWGQNAGRPKPVRVHHAQLARPGSLQLRDKGKGGRPTSYCSVCLSGRGPDKEALQKGGAGCGEERPREAVELLFRLRLQSRAFAPSAGGVSGARGPGQSSTMGFERRVLAWHSGSWRVGSPDVPDQAGSVDPSPGQEPGSLSAGPALPLLPA